MKRLGLYTALVLLTLTTLVLLWQFRQVIILFLLSLAVAAAFRPLIERLNGHGIPRGIALLLSYLAVIAIIAGLIYLTFPSLVNDLEDASNDFIAYYENIRASWPETGTLFQRTLAERLPPPEQLFDVEGGQGLFMAQALFGVTMDFFSFLGNTAIILILSMYWSADAVRFERLFLSFVPVDQRSRMRRVWGAIEQGVGAYVRSEIVQSILAGLLLWLGFRLLGLQYPTLLALIGALAWLIPWFGGFIAIIPPVLVGLGASWLLGAAAAVYTLIVLLIMETVVEARLLPRQRYSSIILVLVLLVMADAFGLIGLILAPLLAAALQITVRHLFETQTILAPQYAGDPEAVEELKRLKERFEEAQQALEASQEPPSHEMINLMARLKRLLDETSEYLFPEPEARRQL